MYYRIISWLSLTIFCFVVFQANFCLAKKKKRIKIKFGSIVPEGTPWADTAKRVEKVSKKKFKVKIYLGGILGGEKALTRRCKKGSLQIYGGSVGAIATMVPMLDMLELPFVYNTLDETDFVLDKVADKELKKALYDGGYKLMEWAENGWRNFASNKRFIKSPQDLKGLKMRAQEHPNYIATWKAFGASPLPIAVPEVLSSLQTGVVDGFDQTLLFTFASSWYQGIKYYSISRHIHQGGLIAISRKFWDSLSPDLQAVLMKNTDKETRIFRRKVRKLSPILLKNIQNAGINVYRLSDQERQSFAKLAMKVHTTYLANASPKIIKIYKKIMAALKKRRGK